MNTSISNVITGVFSNDFMFHFDSFLKMFGLLDFDYFQLGHFSFCHFLKNVLIL